MPNFGSLLASEGLLERDSEVERLAGLVQSARAGAGAVVIVEGPAGIGKTSLLGAVRTLAAEHGLARLAARGGELERDFAYGIVRQLFEAPLAAATARERTRLLEGAAGLAAPVVGFASERNGGPVGDLSFATLHGLYWLASNLALRTPLLLEVDDLHWADDASLRFLAYLARRIDELPILVLGAARAATCSPQVELLEAISHEPLAMRLELTPLSEAAVSELVTARLGKGAEPRFCRACHEATAGNPFLATTLLAALADEDVPPTAAEAGRLAELATRAVSSVVVRRLGRLAPQPVALAEAVAILGTDAGLQDAAELAELTVSDAAVAADTLAAQGILRPGRPLEFVHPVVRASVRDQIPPGRRALTHARAARIVGSRGAAAERIAAHLLAAEPVGDAWTVARLRDAAHAAIASGAADAAASYLRRALREPPLPRDRAEVLFELGSAELLSRSAAAIEHLRDAVTHATTSRRRAEMSEVLARALFFAGRVDEAVAAGSSAIEELGNAHPELRRRLEANLLNAANMHPGHAQLGAVLAARVRREPVGEDVGAKALSAAVAYRDARACSDPAGAVDRARRALGGDVLMKADNGGAPFVQAALVLAMADSERALEVYDAGLAAGRAQGSLFAVAANRIFRGHALLLRGALAEAEDEIAEGLDAAISYGIAIAPAWASAFLADALMERGRLEEAAAALERAGLSSEPPDDAHAHWFLDSRARLSLVRGDPRRALAGTLVAGERFERVGGRNPAWMPWRSQAALALLALGEDAQRARGLAAEELELARAWGAPRALGRALRVAGLVAGGEEGIAMLAEAVEVLEGSTARLELAYSLADLGAARRRSGQRAAAREPLARGLELAHRCGAAPLAARAREELVATGARPRRVIRTGVDALTASELRVARMAAQGMTNREVAQALFVTLRTVEVHLTHTYQKLDITTRAELPAALNA